MPNHELIMDLSVSQGAVLDSENLERLASILRRHCGSACSLKVEASSSDQTAHASCSECIDPKNVGLAVTLVPRLANSLILDSALVDPQDADRLSMNDAERMQMVIADKIPDQYSDRGAVLLGVAATVIKSSGYVKVDNDNTLFFAKPANEQALIDPGTPVLIERPA